MLSIFDDLVALTSSTKYPPTTIYSAGDSLFIEVATAGFAKSDLTVSVDGSYLIIEGEKATQPYPNDATFYQKGIAFRNFILKYHINSIYNLEEAIINYSNGLLQIQIPKISAKKSKKILEIT